AFRPYRRPALIERRIAAVLAAVPRVDRAPASAGPRRLAPLHARPALGVSVGEQQSRYCDAEQNKTDRAHGSSPGPSFQFAAHRLDQCGGPSNFETELRSFDPCLLRANKYLPAWHQFISLAQRSKPHVVGFSRSVFPVRSPSARSMRRPVEFRDRVKVVDPCLLRANKYLPAWHQFISLAQRSKPQAPGSLTTQGSVIQS